MDGVLVRMTYQNEVAKRLLTYRKHPQTWMPTSWMGLNIPPTLSTMLATSQIFNKDLVIDETQFIITAISV